MKGYVIIAVLVCCLLVVGCVAAPPEGATHFTCFQQGEKIIDVVTKEGAELDLVYIGKYRVLVWVWEEKGVEGKKYLTDSDTVSCMQDPVE